MSKPLERSCWGALDQIGQLIGRVSGTAYGCQRWDVESLKDLYNQILDMEDSNNTVCRTAATADLQYNGDPGPLVAMEETVLSVLNLYGDYPGGHEELAKEEVGRGAANATIGLLRGYWEQVLEHVYEWYALTPPIMLNGDSTEELPPTPEALWPERPEQVQCLIDAGGGLEVTDPKTGETLTNGEAQDRLQSQFPGVVMYGRTEIRDTRWKIGTPGEKVKRLYTQLREWTDTLEDMTKYGDSQREIDARAHDLLNRHLDYLREFKPDDPQLTMLPRQVRTQKDMHDLRDKTIQRLQVFRQEDDALVAAIHAAEEIAIEKGIQAGGCPPATPSAEQPSIDPEIFLPLYWGARDRGEETFIYEGQEIAVGYARYLVEYMGWADKPEDLETPSAYRWQDALMAARRWAIETSLDAKSEDAEWALGLMDSLLAGDVEKRVAEQSWETRETGIQRQLRLLLSHLDEWSGAEAENAKSVLRAVVAGDVPASETPEASIDCHLEHWYHYSDEGRFADPNCKLGHWQHPADMAPRGQYPRTPPPGEQFIYEEIRQYALDHPGITPMDIVEELGYAYGTVHDALTEKGPVIPFLPRGFADIREVAAANPHLGKSEISRQMAVDPNTVERALQRRPQIIMPRLPIPQVEHPQEFERIRNLALNQPQHQNNLEFAEANGLSESQVSTALRLEPRISYREIPIEQQPRLRLSPFQREDIRQFVAANPEMTKGALTEIFGIKHRTLRRIVGDELYYQLPGGHGIEGEVKTEGHNPEFRAEVVQEAVDRKDLSLEAIADKHGINKKTLTRWMLAAGVERGRGFTRQRQPKPRGMPPAEPHIYPTSSLLSTPFDGIDSYADAIMELV